MTAPKLRLHDTTYTYWLQPLVALALPPPLVILIAGLFMISPGVAMADSGNVGTSYYGTFTPQEPLESQVPKTSGGTWSGDMISTSYLVEEGEWLHGEPQEIDRAAGAGLSWLQYLGLAALLTVFWWQHIAASIRTSWQGAVENYSAHLAMLDDERASVAPPDVVGRRLLQLIFMPPIIFFWVLAGAPELQRLWRGPGF